jgi:hypothetical protein
MVLVAARPKRDHAEQTQVWAMAFHRAGILVMDDDSCFADTESSVS